MGPVSRPRGLCSVDVVSGHPFFGVVDVVSSRGGVLYQATRFSGSWMLYHLVGEYCALWSGGPFFGVVDVVSSRGGVLLQRANAVMFPVPAAG